ncbi:MAG: starch-binding protein, partial [Ruminococcus sp.]|nr:starch-binding protein [Ruminococcus sp.]
TVYLDNASSWSKPYVYYWSDSSTPITWPGVEMKKNSDGKWTYAIPEGMTKCIFSNNGTDQTSNLDVPTDDKNTYDLATNSWK